MTKKKGPSVALVCCGFSKDQYIARYCKEGGQFTDEVYTINRMGIALTEISGVFRMDNMREMEKLDKEFGNVKRYHKALHDRGIPIITSTAYEEGELEYPLDLVINHLRLDKHMAANVLFNSCNYALAWILAVRKPREVLIYGVDWCKPNKVESEDIKEPAWRTLLYEGGARVHDEPGAEGFAFLLGWMHAKRMHYTIPGNTTFMNIDVNKDFYGYWEQPYAQN